jgi:hypothetical protein
VLSSSPAHCLLNLLYFLQQGDKNGSSKEKPFVEKAARTFGIGYHGRRWIR